ncbi:hypothetical protein PHPALM_12696 [Phytophthora palmivora]|uniref:PiggyBac transposable element-derived protein domain-containing protein n=1 Tax=Phytophthora palmivora TaxID=4796 RepID=A0A2P4XZ30_9STRA|nr:hypothetical protein PHPALM_12696 [Phytophthora palmivora]
MSISSISSGEENASAAIAAHCPEDEGSQPVEGEVEDDGSVSAHGRKWIHCDAVYIDPASFGPARKAALHWPPHLQLGERSFASYFYLMYPMDSLQTTIAETNKLLSERHHGIIGRGELFRWIGIRLAMTLEPRRGPITVFWESSVPEGSVGTSANYGKQYGITCRTFQNIQSALRFAPSQAPTEDPWYAVRPLIGAFNKHRKRYISPGAVLCVDECPWQGREEKYTHDGIPHLTKIKRKPEGVGAELKSIADGDTGVLLGLEIMEAVVLHLSQPYAGSGCTIVADSAFASVKTLVQLNLLLGLYFIGMVKTATKEYPLEYLKCWSSTDRPRGSHVVMESNCVNGTKMYALCWNDRKPKMIISNRGTTLPGSDSVRRYEKRIPRPYMVELFFEYFSTVEVHDHYRQGSLEIEREWLTHSWAHRIFDTVLGMVVVDSYLAYRYEKSWVRRVCFPFGTPIVFQYLPDRPSEERESNGGSDLDDTSLPVHTLLALGDRPEYQQLKNTSQRAQRRCKVCKKKASFYCAICSDCDADRYVALCGSTTGRTCYQQHLAASQHSLSGRINQFHLKRAKVKFLSAN